MTILLGIIVFHVICFYSARSFKKISLGAVFLLLFISLLITAWLVFGMYTMEMPDTTDQFY